MAGSDDRSRTWIGGQTSVHPIVDSPTVGDLDLTDVDILTDLPATPEAAGRYLLGPPGIERPSPVSIGEGAIGRVLLLFDSHLGREVAVKELIRGARISGSKPTGGPINAATERFVREARVTAQLEHPSIVPVYELGRRPDGTLYYVMRRIRGQTLSDALKAAPDVAARLRLLGHFVDLCNAMAYAHSRGVIHRDLKPQNVMVGEFGETVVLDWGLAKVRGQKDTRGRELERGIERLVAAEGQTVEGSTMGTPAYMSPEQAHGRVEDIDERSDLWSLGAVLFELLVGKPPFRGDTAHEVLDKVRTAEVGRVRARERRAPPELAAIAEKALTRDPALRYPDARALARDVEAWRNGDRVEAYAYAPWEVAGRWIFRHGRIVTVLMLASLAVATAGVVFLRNLWDERERARAAESSAQLEEFEARRTLASALVERAAASLRDGDPQEAWVYGAGALAIEETADARGSVVAGRSLGPVRLVRSSQLPGACQGLAWSPDGARLACITSARLHVWDRAGSEQSLAEPDAPTGATGGLVWSEDGSQVAVGGAGTVKIYEAASGKGAGQLRTDGADRLWSLVWHPDGRILAGSEAGRMFVWEGDALVGSLGAHGSATRALALAPDGSTVVSAGSDHRIRFWDSASLREHTPFHEDGQGGLAIAWSPDGRSLAAAGDASGGDGLVRVWDVDRGKVRSELVGHLAEVGTVSWHPEGRILASGAADGSVRLWDVPARRAVGQLRGPDDRVVAVAFAPNGDEIAVAGSSGSVQVWAVSPAAIAGIPVQPRAVNAVAWSLDGARVALAGGDGSVVVWNVTEGAPAGPPLTFPDGVSWVAFAADGALVLQRRDGSLSVFAAGSDIPRFTVAPGAGPFGVPALSPERTRVAVGDAGGFRVVTLSTGAVEDRPLADGRTAAAIAWMPDSRSAIVRDSRGGLRRYDLVDGVERGGLGTIAEGYGAPAVSDDGSVAAASSGSTIVLWSLPEGTQKGVFSAHTDAVTVLRFSADGERLASGSADRSVILWDVESGRLVARWEAHRNGVRDLAWSPGGAVLASASADHTARLWRLDDLATPPGELLARAGREMGLVLSGASLGFDPAWVPEETPPTPRE